VVHPLSISTLINNILKAKKTKENVPEKAASASDHSLVARSFSKLSLNKS
jgi:hypothetical protein